MLFSNSHSERLCVLRVSVARKECAEIQRKVKGYFMDCEKQGPRLRGAPVKKRTYVNTTAVVSACSAVLERHRFLQTPELLVDFAVRAGLDAPLGVRLVLGIHHGSCVF